MAPRRPVRNPMDNAEPHINLNAKELPESSAMFKAELMVLSQIRDSLVAVTERVDDVRERVIRIEAEAASAKIAKVEAALESYKENSVKQIRTLELQIAKWQGTFLPLTIGGTMLLAAVVSFLANAVLGAK